MIETDTYISQIINDRLDAYYYNSIFVEFYSKLYKINCVELGSIINSITNGIDYREYSLTGIPYIKVGNTKQGEFDFSNIQYIEYNLSDVTKSIQLKRGNILLTRKGTFGNALYLADDYNYVISSEIFNLDIKQNDINSKYLEILLNSPIGQIQFDRNKIGAIMGSLSQDAVKKILIPLPSEKIQQKIVDLYQQAQQIKQTKEQEAKALLDSIDDYILKELGIKLPKNVGNEKYFEVDVSELMGGRLDVGYYSINNCNKEFTIKHSKYQLGKMSDYCMLQAGYAFKSEDYVSYSDCKLITIKNISKNIILLDDCTYLPDEYFGQYKNFQIHKDDLLIAMTGATIGKVGIFGSEEKALLNQRNGIIRSSALNTFWLMNLLNTELYQSLILRNSVGGAQPNISETNILKLPIPLPSIEKQNGISEHIQSIRAKAKQLQKEAEEVLEKVKQQIEQIIVN
jgi:restriction endonuclease S subunit